MAWMEASTVSLRQEFVMLALDQSANVRELCRRFTDLRDVQREFDKWRAIYNCERPHEALDLQAPVTRYQASVVAFPETLADIEYPDGDTVLYVGWNGITKFRSRKYRFSSALHKLPIGIRPKREHEDVFEVYFCHQKFAEIDLRTA